MEFFNLQHKFLVRNRKCTWSSAYSFSVTNFKLTSSITSSVLHKRDINNLSLSPKTSTITQETIDPNIPNISTKSDEISKDTVDTALDYISDNNSTNELTVRLKRKSHDSLSNSEENILTKKAKLSHENDNDNDNTSIIDSIELSHDNTSVIDSIELPQENTSVIDSIELDTSAPREITNTQLSEVASNTTNSLVETTSQLETQMNNLASYLISQQTQQVEAFRLIDDIETAISLFDDYRGGLTAQVEEIEQSIYAHNQNIINTYINDSEVNEDIPILDNNSESTRSDSWDNNSEQNNLNDTFEPNIYDDEQNNWENNSEFNNLDNDPNNLNNNFEPNILDNNFRPDIIDNNFRPDIFNSLEDNFDLSSDGSSIFNEIIENIGMEPLDNGALTNQVIYSDQIRADDIIYNNYIIHMRGIDNIDYRVVYYDIIECLDNLDLLIAEHQALEASERVILPLVNGLFDIQHEIVREEISSILETLSHLL